MMDNFPAFWGFIKSDKKPDKKPPNIQPHPRIIKKIPIYILELSLGINLVDEVDTKPKTRPSNIKAGMIATIFL
jgi:hypothetical protein